MTLVCIPSHSMPSHSYSSAGVDVMYPNSVMNSHYQSESDWNSISPLVRSPYEQRSPFPFSRPQEPLPSSVPEFNPPPYSQSRRPPPIHVNTMPNHLIQISRPKSSPSTFGPNVEDLLFTENPFRMKNEDQFPPPIFTLSPQSGHGPISKAASPYYPSSEYAASNASHSPIRSRPIPIAPDPVGLHNMNAMKRAREDEETSEYGPRKRKRAASQSGPVELNEEEQLLLKLKEEENLPWKDIAVRFQTDLNKSYQVPALQMRFKRLRERMRTWTETDVQALEQAFDYWEKSQFDIIAAKMLDFGASERWPAKYCARKWEELHPGRGPYITHSNYLRDPWDNALTASPVGSSIGHLSPRTATM